MSQGIFSTINPDTTTGIELATMLTDLKEALVSGMSGATRPAELDAGGMWVDTSLQASPDFIWSIKIWTGSSDVEIFKINLNTLSPSISGSSDTFQLAKLSADSAAPVFKFLKERIANNGQTLTGDYLGEIQFVGAGSDNSNPIVCRIRAVSLDDTTGSVSGGYLSFETTADNSGAIAEHMRIIDGKLGVGTQTPEAGIHVVSTTGIKTERIAEDAIGTKVTLKKRRIATSGQVVNNDVIGAVEYASTDSSGNEATTAKVEAVATQNHTGAAKGSKVSVSVAKTGQTTLTSQVEIGDTVVVNAPMTTQAINATTITAATLNVTTLNAGTTTEIQDPQIILNKGGNAAAAQSASAGIVIEMTDGTNHAIVYDSTLASKFKIGAVGAAKEIVNVDSVQTLSNKMMLSLKLDKLDVASTATIASLSADKAIINITGTLDTVVQGIAATGASGAIVIHNGGTGRITLSNQNASASANDRLKLPNSTDIIITSDSSAELFYHTGETRWKVKSGSGTGSGGSGGINYISLNPDAESSVNAWSTYNDSNPIVVDGIGGSPLVTLARVTSTPLRGIASFELNKPASNNQGNGFSFDFTIDRADRFKVLRGSFDYEITSGAYVSDLYEVFIYDVTNAAVVYCTPSKIKLSTLVESFNFEFQTSSSTSYRLCIHVAGTSASAAVMRFDNFKVGPYDRVYGSIATDMVPWTPTFGGWSVSSSDLKWRRVGDNLHAIGTFQMTTGAGAMTMSLPNGLTIDSNKISTSNYQTVGMASISTASAHWATILAQGNLSTVTFGLHNVSSSGNTPFTSWSAERFQLNFSVPITGWSSQSQVVTSDFDSRIIAMSATGTVANVTASNPIIFPTVTRDTSASYNPATGKYLCPSTGWYQIESSVSAGSTTTARIYTYINDVISKQIGMYTGTGTQMYSASGLEYLVAGQTLDLRPNFAITGFAPDGSLSIFKVQSPAQVMASEKIIACVTSTATLTSPNGTPTIFTSTVIDTHSSYSLVDGLFRAPSSGIYEVSAAGINPSTTANFSLFKNGSWYQNFFYTLVGGASSGSIVVSCVAGDTLSFVQVGTANSLAFVSSQQKPMLTFKRL